jgi:1-acyl-sn-glycerol-3-phosphate acyltransferase
MSPQNSPLDLFRTLLFTDPLIILSTIFFGSLSLVIALFERTGRKQLEVARVWARTLLFAAGVRLKSEGLEKIDPSGAYVFAANHLSYMDTPVILSTIPVQFRFLAKRGLFQIPFLGSHLITAGHIPVPREDPRAAVKSLQLAAETIRAKRVSLLVFPEGGRSANGDLQSFKEGAAYIAIRAGVPVVPLAIEGTRKILAMHTATFHRGSVRLRIGDPIPTTGLTLKQREALTEKIREHIAAMLEGKS